MDCQQLPGEGSFSPSAKRDSSLTTSCSVFVKFVTPHHHVRFASATANFFWATSRSQTEIRKIKWWLNLSWKRIYRNGSFKAKKPILVTAPPGFTGVSWKDVTPFHIQEQQQQKKKIVGGRQYRHQMKQEIWGEKMVWICPGGIWSSAEVLGGWSKVAHTHLAFPDLAVLDIIINITYHCFIVTFSSIQRETRNWKFQHSPGV